jgi:uncharacterized membrane protein
MEHISFMEMIWPLTIVVFTILVIRMLSVSKNIAIKTLLDWLPAILMAYIIPAFICNFAGLNFDDHIIHKISRNALIPFTILIVMSSMSLKELKSIGWKPLVVFISGSFFIALFPVLLFIIGKFVPYISEWLNAGDQWKGLITVIGSWIGGSISQLVLKEAVECPENVFLSILIFDNLMVNIWTIIMFQFIKRSDVINNRLGITAKENLEKINITTSNHLGGGWILLVMALITAMNYVLNLPFITQIIVLSLTGLMIGNFWIGWNKNFALQVASILIMTIMAILGLKLKFDNLSMNVQLILILCTWISGHFLFTVFVAWRLKTNMAWVAIGSMANVGGIATAPAVTATYDKKMMPHAIILAVLSMATGTFWGLCTIWLVGMWF